MEGSAQRLRIVGLSNTESRDIIRLLQAYITRPENVVRVDWEPDQLVLFAQHYAPDNYDNQPRKLNRVIVAGDIPVGVDGKPSQALQGDSSTYSETVVVVPAAILSEAQRRPALGARRLHLNAFLMSTTRSLTTSSRSCGTADFSGVNPPAGRCANTTGCPDPGYIRFAGRPVQPVRHLAPQRGALLVSER
ncbi:hypothetical protein QFZ79_003967 [Arthrobacter sp. V4I6]|nr:hypothetical protein [Arthrobacter sp. V1I7]MDQ0855856.1 hypothetical protein [Arthrobacter sp. V4I6]